MTGSQRRKVLWPWRHVKTMNCFCAPRFSSSNVILSLTCDQICNLISNPQTVCTWWTRAAALTEHTEHIQHGLTAVTGDGQTQMGHASASRCTANTHMKAWHEDAHGSPDREGSCSVSRPMRGKVTPPGAHGSEVQQVLGSLGHAAAPPGRRHAGSDRSAMLGVSASTDAACLSSLKTPWNGTVVSPETGRQDLSTE